MSLSIQPDQFKFLYTLGIHAEKCIKYVPERTIGSMPLSPSGVVGEICEITKCVLRPVSGLPPSSEQFFKKRMLHKRMDYLSRQIQQSSSSSTQEILGLLSKIKIAVESCLKTDSQSLISTNKIYEYTLLIGPLVKEMPFVPLSLPKRQQKFIDKMVGDLWSMIAIINITSYDDAQKVLRFKHKITNLYVRAEDHLCEPFFWKTIESFSQIENVFSKNVRGYGNSVMLESSMIDLNTESRVEKRRISKDVLEPIYLILPPIFFPRRSAKEPINLLDQIKTPKNQTIAPVAKKSLKSRAKRKIVMASSQIPKVQEIANNGESIVVRPMMLVSSEKQAQSVSIETSSQSSSDTLGAKKTNLSDVQVSIKKSKKVHFSSRLSKDKRSMDALPTKDFDDCLLQTSKKSTSCMPFNFFDSPMGDRLPESSMAERIRAELGGLT